MARRMGPDNSRPPTVSTALSPPLARKVVETAVFISESRFAPKYWEITTEQPMLQPMATAMNSMVTG